MLLEILAYYFDGPHAEPEAEGEPASAGRQADAGPSGERGQAGPTERGEKASNDLTPVSTIRTEFPETWIWDELIAGY